MAVLAISTAVTFSAGCGIVDTISENLFSAVGLTDTGTVISKRANIRSSYAVVAADILEVKRNDQLEVLEEFEDDQKVLWYRVRAHDEDETEGWIEAQHVIKEESLEKSRKLLQEDAAKQTQALGQLRAESNLRLTPKVEEGNILLRLDNGASFEIVEWVYVTKDKSEEEKTENEEIKAAEEDKPKEPAKLSETYDTWYKVRLDPTVSPAPMGWVFGGQVSLQIPGDIVYFQSNDRKFVTWHRIDEAAPQDVKPSDPGASNATPGSWVILTRTDEVKAIEGVEPEFDGILILGFDKYDQQHYTVWNSKREKLDIWGRLPLRMEGEGDNKSFIVNIRNSSSGQMEEKRFVLFRDKSKRIKLTAPEGLSKIKDDKGK
ncbi:MAG: hypothetical protein R2684_09820 [Pyrinomonadaceae bacterium]